MQCPICSSELAPGAVVCASCGATQITQRTSTGIMVGWVGMVIALLMAMMWAFVAVLPFTDVNMKGFPWLTLIIGTAIAAGMLWYSRSTRHTKWVRRGS